MFFKDKRWKKFNFDKVKILAVITSSYVHKQLTLIFQRVIYISEETGIVKDNEYNLQA